MSGVFLAWILQAHDEDQLRLSPDGQADAADRQAFDHEAVQKPEPYFKGDTRDGDAAPSTSHGHLIVRMPDGSERHVIVRIPDGSESDADLETVIQVGQAIPGFGGLVLEHFEHSSALDEEGRPYLVAVLGKPEL